MTCFRQCAKDGLWQTNPVLVQMLGLCPLLAVSNSVINGLVLGLATSFVMLASSFFVALIQKWLTETLRIPIFVIIIAGAVSIVELLMQAYAFETYQSIGLFIPLIVTNCAIMGRLEAFAKRNNPLIAASDGLLQGLGFTWVLVGLGALREILGSGTLFAGIEQFIPNLQSVTLIETNHPMILFILPAGAFFALAMMVAAYMAIEKRAKNISDELTTAKEPS